MCGIFINTFLFLTLDILSHVKVSDGQVQTEKHQCPPNFQLYKDRTCVGRVAQQVSYYDSKKELQGIVGEIIVAAPHDYEFNTWIKSSFPTFTEAYWMGLQVQQPSGFLVWTDGENNSNWAKWKPGEPSTNDERCVKLKNLNWEHKKCSESHDVFCQYVLYNNESSCIASFTLVRGTKTCLLYSTKKGNLDYVRTQCQGLSPSGRVDVAVLKNETLHSAALSLSNYGADAWIGLNDLSNHLEFVWEDGTNLNWPKWEVNITSTADNCYEWKAGVWTNKKCTDLKFVLCQYTAPACQMLRDSNNISTYNLHHKNGRSAYNKTISVFNSLFHRCAQSCIQNTDCGSFNFNPLGGICELKYMCDHTISGDENWQYWQ